MRKKAPLVRDCMTHLPVEAERCETVSGAERLMGVHNIHHLPVMSGSHLKGILSQRDILTARLRWGDASNEKSLEEICQSNVLTVGPTAPIDEVAIQMLDRQAGSVVVVDGGYVVGMFTKTDALRLISKLFNK